MPKNKTVIPKAPVLRLMKDTGAKRVSSAAVQEVCDYLTKEGERIAVGAVTLSKHSGRTTVLSSDVRLSAR
ncbi:MAG TPA: histone [Acidobacteriota bacterium]|nr:histone [Acidobacteriota bacterium]